MDHFTVIVGDHALDLLHLVFFNDEFELLAWRENSQT
jgi:hypothetical protein